MNRILAVFVLTVAFLGTALVMPQSVSAEDANTGANGLPRKPCPSSMGSCSVSPGESVAGAIIYQNGTRDTSCYIQSVPSGATVTVTDGVVNFWNAEVASLRVCSFGSSGTITQTGTGTVNGLARRSCPNGSPCVTNSGEAVVGYAVTSGGRTEYDCYYANAPAGVTVEDGVVNPWTSEAQGKRACSFVTTTKPGSSNPTNTGAGTINGSVRQSQYSLIVFGGGTTEQLVKAANCRGDSAIFWSVQNGRWVGYIEGAPRGANNDWNSRFSRGIPAQTPIVAKCL